MDVSDIMTSHPVTVATYTSLDEALQLMDDQDVRHLPVLEDGELVGVVSDRDLLQATGWHPVRADSRPDVPREDGRPTTVRDIMHTKLSVVGTDDTVVTAAVEFVLMGIGCLPVLRDGELVGIVTEMDVLMAFWRAARQVALEGDVDPSVSSKMAQRPTTVREDMTLEHAATLCRSVHCRHLPVTRGDELVGIISDRDLRAAMGSGRFAELLVRDTMASECVTTGPETRLSTAAEVMVGNRFSALPVVTDDHRLIGILTITDLLDHCMNTLREPEAFPVV